MKYLAVTGGALLAVGVLAGLALPDTNDVAFVWSSETTDNAYVRGEITPISSKVAGYVSEVLVEDNQRVASGDILFRIDDRDYRAKLSQADATYKAKQAAIENLNSQITLQRSAILQAEAAFDGAQADAERARLELGRTQSLIGSGVTSQASAERAGADARKTASMVAQAQANTDAAVARLDVLESQRPQLQAEIASAQAAADLAALDLEATLVKAPSDGTVSERLARVGQYVRTGSSLISIVSEEKWVVANFKETQIQKMKAGTAAIVIVDSLSGEPLRAEIESLSPASGSQFALLPPDNATGNFTRVLQRIPVRLRFLPGDSRMEFLKPGMSAVVRIVD